MDTGAPPATSEGPARPDSAPHRADARRLASASVADLAVRQAEAIAALDRALATRLGDLDRAMAVRHSNLVALADAVDRRVAGVADEAVAEVHRSGSGERRVLNEAVAAELAAVEGIVAGYRAELRAQATSHREELRVLANRIAGLERAVDALAARSADAGMSRGAT